MRDREPMTGEDSNEEFMDHSTGEFTKRVAPRSELRTMRDFVWEWDTIGVGQLREVSEDEYDCIIGSVLIRLHQRQSADEITGFLEPYLLEHFGISPTHGLPDFVQKAVAWYTASGTGAARHDPRVGQV